MSEQQLDSAIPVELQRTRRCPAGMSTGFTPPYPSYAARFAPASDRMVMAYLGVQYQGERPGQVSAALLELDHLVGMEHGPTATDRTQWTDPQGFLTIITVAYWSDPDAFQRWMGVGGDEWVHRDRGIGAGYFLEVLQPAVERFETLFSSTGRLEGVSRLADGLSGEIAEHGYWGGMRDRLPIAQTDALEPGRTGLTRREHNGVTYVTADDNLCLIRSGQDWTDTDADERSMYLEDVEPSLRAGMDYLSGPYGIEIGCLANRYVTLVDVDGEPVGKTFGMSWWRSLEDLERWARSHPTHQRIFGAAMKYLGSLGPAARLRLYHEVSVVGGAEQRFEYRNCHPHTGLLAVTSGEILARTN